jgi:murein DD-endopeptidase MepM/ murein hydrolase activator NlpD
VISYPGYQVAVARRGDTVTSIANRLGLAPGDVARYNAIGVATPLREGEVVALPARVGESSGQGGGAGGSNGQIDIASLATGAIDRSQAPNAGAGTTASVGTSAPAAPAGVQPVRHKVKRGETAYTIARLYNVPVRALADWNGLGPNLSVHEGQVLLIPPVDTSQSKSQAATAAVTAPGQQSPAPEPPSASKPLPATTPAAASAKTKVPASPNMSKDRTSASASKYMMPVSGKIIRPFSGKNPGIDIAAPAGSPVKAAAGGTVALVTKDTSGRPIIILSHADKMLTVYANVGRVEVKKGEAVKRGQVIGSVRSGSPAYVHFEIRKGMQSVDPTSLLQ